MSFYSSYFDKAINGGFEEAAKKEVKLPEAETDVFNAVQNWFYSHRFHPEIEENSKKISWSLAPRIWVFADARGMPALQNAAIDLIHTKCIEEWMCPMSEVGYVYGNTLEGSLLRKYFITLIAEIGQGESLVSNPENVKQLTRNAACDILKLVWDTELKRKSKDEIKTWDLCQYHVHEDGVKCRKQTSGTKAKKVKK